MTESAKLGLIASGNRTGSRSNTSPSSVTEVGTFRRTSEDSGFGTCRRAGLMSSISATTSCATSKRVPVILVSSVTRLFVLRLDVAPFVARSEEEAGADDEECADIAADIDAGVGEGG